MRSYEVATLAAFALLCINVTIAQYLSSCQTPDGDTGTCVLVRECPFVQAVLKKAQHSNNDIRYVEAIRCGTLETRPLVCCNAPNVTQTVEPVDPETIAGLVENRFSTYEEKLELLPKVCGGTNSNTPSAANDGVLGNTPWTVLIQHRTKEGENRFHCGGALINARYVLTAARCIMGIKKTWNVESVRVGESDLETEQDCQDLQGNTNCAPGPQDITIEKITIHPNYTGSKTPAVKHDVALIRLTRKVEMSDSIGPICLPTDPAVRQDLNLEKGDFMESGWGITPEAVGNGRKQNFLSAGESRDVCRRTYPHADIDEGHICAKPNLAAYTCTGDAGGALMHRNLNTMYLVGIASFRKECANVGEPAVYTNVRELVDWIVDNLEP